MIHRPHTCPFCKLTFVDMLKHVGKCNPALVQLSEQPDLVRVRTEDPNVLVDEAVAQMKVLYEKRGRELNATEEAELRAQALANIKFLRGEGP